MSSTARDIADSFLVINHIDNVTHDIQEQINTVASSSGGAALYTFIEPVTDQYFNKVSVINNNLTVSGTWELFGDSEVWVSSLNNVENYGEYLVGTQSVTNHIFYKTLYIGDDTTVTVTDVLQGIGMNPSASEEAGATPVYASNLSAVNVGSLGQLTYSIDNTTFTFTAPNYGKLLFLGGI